MSTEAILLEFQEVLPLGGTVVKHIERRGLQESPEFSHQLDIFAQYSPSMLIGIFEVASREAQRLLRNGIVPSKEILLRLAAAGAEIEEKNLGDRVNPEIRDVIGMQIT